MISPISFGAGPVPGLLTNTDGAERQRATIRQALESGINWFDTAATYGEGNSERSLGAALNAPEIAGNFPEFHIATKVRIPAEHLGDIRGFVRRSFAESLERLRQPRVTLLQLHNSITIERGDHPTSISVDDVLGPGGVLAAFRELRGEGQITNFGLTGLGSVPALSEVLATGEFETIQIPYHLLNPSAGAAVTPAGIEADYGNLITECARLEMGVLAIRVFAGGALVGQSPSAHTRTTKFFPLALYERDRQRAEDLRRQLPAGLSLPEVAVRFVLSHPGVSSALVGFAGPEQVEEALGFAERGPLEQSLTDTLECWWQQAC